MIKTAAVILMVTGIIIWVVNGFFLKEHPNYPLLDKSPVQNSNIPDSSSGFPKTVKIAKLGINAPVEAVGLDADGRMDVPKQWYTVGWYNLGYKIGSSGAAVMSGHLDTYSGEPAVFWDLGKLNLNDEIVVTDTTGKSYTFQIYEKQTYKENALPLQRIFGSANIVGLNLITCAGNWDKNSRNYSERVVIYSKLVKEGGK